MEPRGEQRELIEMLESLIKEVEAHACDYHHVTSPALLARARELVRRVSPRDLPDSR